MKLYARLQLLQKRLDRTEQIHRRRMEEMRSNKKPSEGEPGGRDHHKRQSA